MPIRISTRGKRRKVVFPSAMSATGNVNRAPSSRLEEILDDSNRIEELSESSDMESATANSAAAAAAAPRGFTLVQPRQQDSRPTVPRLFTEEPPVKDKLETATSTLQNKTIKECLPFLNENPYRHDLNSKGAPHLLREQHAEFLHDALTEYPPQFVVMDASRPWILYWALTGLSVLGEDISQYQSSLVTTFQPCQNPTGGFGGGHGQFSHLAPTYTAVLTHAMVGGETAYESIDRRAMWHWLGQMKQADGGFTMCQGGEKDVRGAYCAMTVLTLLNLPLELPADSPARVRGDETFLTGLPEWISQCQTYEGGLGSAPSNEAHGAYTFCALACLCILGEPSFIIPKYLDLQSLISWLSSRQYAPEGGLAGRTNKVVDGCYSHWDGGCWSLVEAAVAGAAGQSGKIIKLGNRAGLARYILSCCQGQHGGLRDKPSKNPDAYHTCYNLAGLSHSQHLYTYSPDTTGSSVASPPTEPPSSSSTAANDLTAPYAWTVRENDGVSPAERSWDPHDTVETLHPVFVIPWGAPERMRAYFERKLGF